jgi:hypothetical protein
VHFTDSKDKILFQNDHAFCQKLPFESMKGKYVTETFDVKIPQDALDKEIYIKIGFYSPLPPGVKLKITSAGGLSTDYGNARVNIGKLSF